MLKQSLVWLDDWENHLSEGHITKQQFLTNNTAESLRITLTSTIDLTVYLLEECEFKYILSAKFNQDLLEVCNVVILFLIS